MGTGSLPDRTTGVIPVSWFNDIHNAMRGAWVGRNASGAAEASKDLGTVAIPWGTLYAEGININGSSVDLTQFLGVANRVTSGLTRSGSNQPKFIDPNGAALSLQILGSSTNLVYNVNGSSITLSADLTESSLTAAPSSNNTCLVDDANAADQEATRTWGEIDGDLEYITIDTIGSEISSLDGQLAAFKINDGTNDEYFIARVDTTNNRLHHCFRGYFYDKDAAPVNRIKFANNDTITLLKLGWVFLENDESTIEVAYTEPTWSGEEPASPSTGDYWYDFTADQWKRYNGSSFVQINRTLVGLICNDSSACLGARCVDFDATYSEINQFDRLERVDAATVRCPNYRSVINVAGQLLEFQTDRLSWDMSTDLAGSEDMYQATEQASTTYYLYISDDGEPKISDISPYLRLDLLGFYHPHNPWRCVGKVNNDGSSDFEYGLLPYKQRTELMNVPIGSVLAWGSEDLPTGFLECDGSSLNRADYPELFAVIGSNYGTASATTFNLPDCRGRFIRGWANGSGTDPDRSGRSADASGGQSGDNVGSVQSDQNASHTHSVSIQLYNVAAGAAAAVVGGANTSAPTTTVNPTSSSSGGNESRPENIYFQYIIKYGN